MRIDPSLSFLKDSRPDVTASPRQLKPSVVLSLNSAMPSMACLLTSVLLSLCECLACFLLWGQPFFLLPGLLHSVISSKLFLYPLFSLHFSLPAVFFFPRGPTHSVHHCGLVFNSQFLVTMSPNRADRTHPPLCAQHPGQRPHQALVLAAGELSVPLSHHSSL